MIAMSEPTPPTARLPDGPRPHGPEHTVVPEQASWASEYPFESHWLNVGDAGEPMWLHYLDEGPKDGPVIVMLHGNPTWSFFYRDVVKALRHEYRCIVPDHMGCGLSDRPQSWSYTLEDHAANVGKLVDHLGLSQVVLMVHDWGGMIGMTWAVDHADMLAGSVILNTAAFTGHLPWRIQAVRIPGFGKTAVLNFNAFAVAATQMCVTHKERFTTAIKEGFLAPYSTPHDRIATLRFVEDVPLSPSHATWQVVDAVDNKLERLKDKPMLVCWGEKDWCFTPAFRAGWQARFPHAVVHPIADANHYVLEDARERIIPWVEEFLEKRVYGKNGGDA